MQEESFGAINGEENKSRTITGPLFIKYHIFAKL